MPLDMPVGVTRMDLLLTLGAEIFPSVAATNFFSCSNLPILNTSCLSSNSLIFGPCYSWRNIVGRYSTLAPAGWPRICFREI